MSIKCQHFSTGQSVFLHGHDSLQRSFEADIERLKSKAEITADRLFVDELLRKLDSFQQNLPPNTVRRCRDAPGMNAYLEMHSAMLQRLVEVRQFLKSKGTRIY